MSACLSVCLSVRSHFGRGHRASLVVRLLACLPACLPACPSACLPPRGGIMPSLQVVPASSPPWGPEDFLREARGIKTTAQSRDSRKGYTNEEVATLAQSLVAHMPGTFVDLLRSDMVLECGQPVQLGGTDTQRWQDRITDEAIGKARTWLLGIVSACPTKVPAQYLVADAFLVANACMNGRVLRVPSNMLMSPNIITWTSAMAAQAGINSTRMIQHIRHLWRKPLEGPSNMVIDKIKALMRPAPRPAALMYADLMRHGFTPNCKKCDHIVAYGDGNDAKNRKHSEACRTRILEVLAKDEDGQRRIAQAEFRAQRSIAEHIEKTVDESMVDESALGLRELDPPSPKRRRRRVAQA